MQRFCFLIYFFMSRAITFNYSVLCVCALSFRIFTVYLWKPRFYSNVSYANGFQWQYKHTYAQKIEIAHTHTLTCYKYSQGRFDYSLSGSQSGRKGEKKRPMNNGTICLLMVFQLNCSIGFAAKLPDLICVYSFSSNRMERFSPRYYSIWFLSLPTSDLPLCPQFIHAHSLTHTATM